MNWEAIYKKAISEVDTANLGWVALVGSAIGAYKGPVQDIDIIGFSHPHAKNGIALLSFQELTKKVQEILEKDYRKKLGSFANLVAWADISYNIEKNTGTQPFMQHSLFFTDQETFRRVNPRDFTQSVLNAHKTLYGTFNCLDNQRESGEAYQFLHGMSIGPNAYLSPIEVIDQKIRKIVTYLNKHYQTKIKIPRTITPEIAQRIEEEAYLTLDSISN